jgi:hypothetical protein
MLGGSGSLTTVYGCAAWAYQLHSVSAPPELTNPGLRASMVEYEGEPRLRARYLRRR